MAGARKSAKYLFIGGLFSRAISFVGSILLARILFPEDFGYLLIAMIVAGFIQIFGNMGFETFYLQEKINSKEHETKILNITFKLRLLVNGILFLLQIGVSFLAEKYYNNPIIGDMIRISSISILIMAFSQINLYILRKQLNYKPEVYANIGRDVIGTIFKVLFALIGFGALSFVIGGVIGNIVRFFILNKYQKFKPVWKLWDTEIFEKIFYFGKHSFIGGIGMFFTQQIDKILLTTYFPLGVAGNYYFSNSQAQSIFASLVFPQASLVLSYSAKYKHDSTHLFSVLSKIGYVSGIVMVPTMIYLVMYAESIFFFVFGAKWSDSIIMFQIFALYYLATELTFPFSGILTAYGLPNIVSKLVLIRFVVLSVGLILTVYLTSNIYLYLMVYTGINFIFSWLKAYISINEMGRSLWEYTAQLKNLVILSLNYLFIIVLVNIYVDQLVWQLIISFLLIVIISLIFHLSVYKIQFIECLELVLKPDHRILKRIKYYVHR